MTFHGSPASSAPPWKQADLIFWGSTKIDLAAHSQGTLGPDFQVGIAGTHLISVTTHQHELGTGIQAWASAKPGDLANRITDDTDWAAPSLASPRQAHRLQRNEWPLVQVQLEQHDERRGDLRRALSNEMCFVGGYYYPSRGFDLCLDGNCLTRTATDGGAPDSGGASGDL